MERSSYKQIIKLWHLECAIEENCLPSVVHTIIQRNPTNYYWHERALLRFTSVITNVGIDDFEPYEKMERWEWHSCHMQVNRTSSSLLVEQDVCPGHKHFSMNLGTQIHQKF
ncbi:Lysyl oxidase 3 [Cichlidogyrus casuarinus]|uniref:Lysyl oxidase 3 n=1 Tax=Cichlidogyrus casuarinus TaxID=1844966 RepID=A0ABD2PWK5_9PLAT